MQKKQRFTIDDALNAIFKAYNVSEECQTNVLEVVKKRTEEDGKPPYKQFTATRFVVHGIKPLLGWYVSCPERKIGDAIYIELDGKNRRATFRRQIYKSEIYTFDRKNGCIFAYIKELPDDAPVPVSIPPIVEKLKPTLRERVVNFVSRIPFIGKSFEW